MTINFGTGNRLRDPFDPSILLWDTIVTCSIRERIDFLMSIFQTSLI